MKYDKYDKLNRSIPLVAPLIPFPLTAPHSPFSPHTPLFPLQVHHCILPKYATASSGSNSASSDSDSMLPKSNFTPSKSNYFQPLFGRKSIAFCTFLHGCLAMSEKKLYDCQLSALPDLSYLSYFIFHILHYRGSPALCTSPAFAGSFAWGVFHYAVGQASSRVLTTKTTPRRHKA